jgi:hypothetical protein
MKKIYLSIFIFFFYFFVLSILTSSSVFAKEPITTPIYIQNDRLFVQERPTSLFGYGFYAQITDRDFDYQTFLDILAQCDVNFTRIWGLYHAVNPSDLLLPFAGYYRNWNLTQFNPDFFNRLRNYIAYAQSKGIVIQFTLFDYNLLESSPSHRWNCNPYNPNNNITDPIKNADEFDQTSGPIWEINKKYIQEVVKAIGNYNNVIYEIFNEPESIGDSNFHRAVENLLRQELAKYSGSKVISVNGDKYAQYGNIVAYHHPSDLLNKAKGSGKPVILSSDGSNWDGGSGQNDNEQSEEVKKYKEATNSTPPGKAHVEILDNDIWGSSYTSTDCPSPRDANHNLRENGSDPWGINYQAIGILGGNPNCFQEKEAISEAEIISPENTLICTDFNIEYSKTDTSTEYQPLTTSPSLKTLGTTSETQNKTAEGKLWLEKAEQPNFSLIERRLSQTLPKLLPQSLNESLNIDQAPLKTRAKHFIIGQAQENPEQEKIPETELTLPFWWTSLLGQTKVFCGLFKTCEPPVNLALKVEQPNIEELSKNLDKEKEATCPTSNLVVAENPEISEVEEEFAIKSLFTIIKETVEKILEKVKEITTTTTETTTLENRTRGTLVGGKTLDIQSEFFSDFLPQDINSKIKNDPLAGGAKYKIDPENYQPVGERSEKLDFQEQQQIRARYCLQICSLYPKNFNINSIDPLCPSCNPNDYAGSK